jgi:hypothetical protein
MTSEILIYGYCVGVFSERGRGVSGIGSGKPVSERSRTFGNSTWGRCTGLFDQVLQIGLLAEAMKLGRVGGLRWEQTKREQAEGDELLAGAEKRRGD